MKRVMVQYKVKPDRVAENEQLVRDVYAELAVREPGGLRYGTFKLPDGVSFVHLAVHGDENPLQQIEAFQRFQEGIRDRCDEPPAVSQLEEIGSYRLMSEPS
jgi:quinol monooxygenase YgiN